MKRINKLKLFTESELIREYKHDLVLFIKTPKNEEMIIVPNKGIKEKREYIDSNYNYNLNHKTQKGVYIMGVTSLKKWVSLIKENEFKGIGFKETIMSITRIDNIKDKNMRGLENEINKKTNNKHV